MKRGMSNKGLIGLLFAMGIIMVGIMSAMAVISNIDTEKIVSEVFQTELQQEDDV